MNIYSKLSNKTLFSSAELIFVTYLLEHSEEVLNYNIRKLAKQSCVSISTIYRVMDKLELSGFSELKLQLSNHWESYQNETAEVDYNFPFSSHNTHFQILKKIQSLYGQTLESTLNLIDLNVFLKAVQFIKNSENIYILPSSSNFPASLTFKEQMASIGKKVDIFVGQFDQQFYLNTVTNKDVIIFITYLNRSNFANTMKAFKSKGAKIILISSAKELELPNLADVHLKLNSYENANDKIAPFSNRLSVQYLLDCLYSAYFNTNYDKHLNSKKNLLTMTKAHKN